MKERKNCWEFMQCGRESEGAKAGELGVCPVCRAEYYDGVNRGTCAGRFCWIVAGTYCDDEIQGTFARKFEKCLQCPFYKEVERQEERGFVLLPPRKKGKKKE